MIDLLLELGADVNIPDQDGGTPMHLSAYLCDVKLMQSLITKCFYININSVNFLGETPLDIAIITGEADYIEKLKFIKYLLSNGAVVGIGADDNSVENLLSALHSFDGDEDEIIQFEELLKKAEISLDSLQQELCDDNNIAIDSSDLHKSWYCFCGPYLR